ncbi:MAG: hypothetical protein J6386_04700 [Candidatus Synoicihabitans palmerolidicus]|nr:hypothetical protein [Candidatus Synoicihabitans palmerolidicus]MCC5022132.1 hypothetical protein [Candidatus Synoicihabitans palmerolidicus]
MNRKRCTRAIVVIAILAIAFLLSRILRTRSASPPETSSSAQPINVAPEVVPAPPPRVVDEIAVPPAASPPPTVLEDGQTIDFSSGRPVVTATQGEDPALQRALAEIAAATEDIVFPSETTPPPAETPPPPP